MAKTFKYKHIKKQENLGAIDVQPPAQAVSGYTGAINGIKATHGEENLLRAALQTGSVTSYEFRVAMCAPKNFPGWKELDFLFTTKTGEYVAIQVKDYTFVHHGAAATANDNVDDAMMLQDFAKNGVSVRENRIFSVDALDCDTVEEAKKVVETIIL